MTRKDLFEDVLPLAPLQEGMFFHATYDEDALDVYTVRLAVDFEGPFDLDVFREAVRALLIRRSTLRAGFLSENLSRPVQVVPRAFETPVVAHDLSGLDEDERRTRLAALSAAEQTVRFDLTDPPLLRFTVVRLGERSWRLMFNCHHILLDGWSMPIVLGELFELYRRGGLAEGLPPAPSFKLFLAWLRRQDKQAGLEQWRAALDGLAGPTLVAPQADDTVSALPGQLTVDLTEEHSAELTGVARGLGVTVNTLVQVAWGLQLARLTGGDDIVFGATVSGRPPEIEAVENIVGLFINTVPVRVRLDRAESLRALLLRVQDEQSALLDHHYIGLTEIQRAAGHGELFDSLVAFESYPVDADTMGGSLGDLTITGTSGSDATHYPLTLIAVPGRRLQLRLGFRGGLFTEDTAAGLLAGLEALLAAVASDGARPVAEVLETIALPAGWQSAAPRADGAASVSDLSTAPAGGRAPRTPHEEMLCGLFAEVLGVESVSIDDNFFDLGGHSLLATRLVSRIRGVFEIELPVRALFDAQTVVALAERVVGSSVGGRAALVAMVRPVRVPLSFAQRRLWFLNRMEGPSGTYNIPLGVRLSGVLDVVALRAALLDVVVRHESLRTVFPDVEGEPWQQVVAADEAVVPFEVVDVEAAGVGAAVGAAASAGFDLSVDLPVRVWLFRVSADEHVLCVVVHHIAGDGWSQAPLARDLGRAYRARTTGAAPDWEPLPVQYADYALWQREVLGGEDDQDSSIARQLAYWREALADLPDELTLPADRARPAVSTYRGGSVAVEVGARLHRDLVGLARSSRSSLFMVLQAGVSGLLSRLGAGSDVPLGTAIAGRTDAALDELVGFFINTLVLRADVSGDPGFGELVDRVRVTDLAAYAHQDLPFEQLVHALQPSRSMARHPLFQVMIVLQNNAVASLDLPGLVARPLDGEAGAAKFDLGFNFVERTDAGGAPAGIDVTVEYSTDLFDEDTVTDLGKRLVRMLTLGAADPAMPISQFDLLASHEWRQLLNGWNDTARELEPGGQALTIPALFAAQAARTPDALALVAQDGRLTYAEVDARSARLAALLADRGVRPGDVVAVAVPRSAALTLGHLAVLRAGAVCLPVDPDHPAARIRALLADLAPAVVLTAPDGPAILRDAGAPVLVLDASGAPGADEEPATRPGALPGPLPDSPAYLIPVPDPQGAPRGVVVPHRGLVNRLLWMRDVCALGPGDRVLHKAPADLDASVWEVLAPLVTGAAQVTAPPGGGRDMVALARQIHRDAVTTVHFAPSVLEAFLAEPETARCTGLRRVLVNGEPLPPGLSARFRAHLPEARLHVLHGPTEASFDTLVWSAGDGTDGAYAPAGRPVPNTRALVLDAHLTPLPPGSPGELYVGGVQLAHGYRGRAALTAVYFVADPYGPPGSRLHRTGDLARVTRDGTIELLGRADDRLTLDGRRVEPGEVERVLTGHPAVAAAAVTTRSGPTGGPALVAYVVPADPAAPVDTSALPAHVAAELPDHSVPALCVSVDALAYTADGRIDRAALPDPRHSTARAPRDEVERTLCGLFAELLGVESVSIDDSFFDLGGHSLLATRLVSRVRSLFGIELPFRDIFDAQTVVALAERVVGSSVGGRAALVAMVRPVRVPLSFAQRRLWFLNRMEGPSGTYNIPLGVRLSGVLDVVALRAALLDVVVRHESLRTVFPDVEGEPWQQVVAADEAVVPFEVVDVEAAGVGAAVGAAASAGFDLSVDLPVRVWLFRVSADEHVLCVVVHHIAGDGWSQAPLARDLGRAYRARTTGAAPDWEPLPVQYADYALWQREVLGGEDDQDSSIARQLAYWREALADLPDELTLPADRARPAVSTYRGGSVAVEVGARLHRDLVGLARSSRSSLFMVLQAGVSGLLSRLGAGSDVPLGTAIAGRTDAALDELVGFFINTLVLRADVSGDPGFGELVDRVRVTDLAAYAHQDLPFEQLVHALQPSRSMARHPLFQVMIVLQNNAVASLDLPGLVARPLDGEAGAAKFDLGFNFVERTDLDGAPAGIDVTLDYSADLFDEDTARRIGERLVRLLGAGVADPLAPLSGIDLLDHAERDQLLNGWNDTARELEPGGQARTIPALFAAQAARTPDALALVAQDGRLTYAEVDARSARLAALLADRGVRPGDVVAVAVPRSAALTVALLAVLRAGAAYLPIELDYPAERIAHMLDDAAPAAVISTSEGRKGLPGGGEDLAARLIVLDGPGADEEPETRPGALPGPLPDSPAYLIYTSGSTGRPKGVLVPHRGIVNRLLWMQDAYRLGPDDRVLQKTPSGFDVSVWEFFWPLLTGAVQVAARPGGHRDAGYLARLIQDERITTAHFVPSMLEVFLAEPEAARCTGLRRVLCSGEALPSGLSARFRSVLPAGLHNLYGPTEASVDVTAWDCAVDSEAAVVPIGRPIWNTRTYVLDTALAPAPVGAAGELYLGGVQLAHGYRGRAGLTAERFVADPYGPPGSRLYRTGDLARVTRDGVIEFLGRTDDQVKIRGQRVEPGEIEHALAQHARVGSAIVTVHAAGAGGPGLAAYVTPARPGDLPEPAELRDHLAGMLPAHMVPAHYTVIDAVPVTPNGKVDKKALPAPRLLERQPSRAPREGAEAELCAIFAELLGHDTVGVDDNFFELGGHSLLATKLISRVRDRLGAEMSVVAIFEAPTAAALAVRLAAADTAGPLSRLLPLSAGGSGAPLFCVHPLGGLSWPYAGLAEHLPPEVALYGLQAAGLAGDEPLPDSVEEMAADYVEHVRAVQPEGPYRLLGWSLGGRIAHAMAQHLEAAGQRVELLALLDAYPRDAAEPVEEFSEQDFLAGVLVAIGMEASELDGPVEFDRVAAAMRSSGKEIAGLSVDQLRRLQGVMANSVRAEAGSATGRCRADAVMFAATVDPAGEPDAWLRHIDGELEVHHVAVAHNDLMGPQPLAGIGAVLAKKLAGTPRGAGA